VSEEKEEIDAPRPRRRHRGAIYALLVAGTVSAILAIGAIWVSRQALENDNWTETSSKLLEDDEIRAALGAYLVDRLYAEVDVQAELRAALPPRSQPLAGPAAGALRNLAERAADEALQRPRVQALWENANRAAHEQLLRVLEGGGDRVSTEGGVVTLNLGLILQNIAERTGVGGRAIDRLGAESAQIEILRSDQLEVAQDVADGLKPLALVLTLLALACYGGAIALAGDRRRETLRAAGFGFVIAGALILLVRGLAGGAVVDALAKTEAVRPAVESTWDIGTSLLVDVASATIVYGIVFIFAAWLAGPTSAAVAVRRAMAPYLRRPGFAWGGAATLALLLLWWAPTPGLQRVLPSIVLLGLLAAGVELLRRQTAREFPEAPKPELAVELRSVVQRTRAAIGSRRADGQKPETAPALGGGNGVGNGHAAPADPIAALERLADLHDRGALTDEEFAGEKANLLARPS
jgi:hypothetical protein